MVLSGERIDHLGGGERLLADEVQLQVLNIPEDQGNVGGLVLFSKQDKEISTASRHART